MAYIIACFVGIIMLCHQVSSVIKQILCGAFSLCAVGCDSAEILFSQTLQTGIFRGLLPQILV
jgi:Na+/alanine symporter